MIQFNTFTLDNGLTVVVHEDYSTPLVAINILYDVGSKDENPSNTGFAHLFEHLMFAGSKHVPSYDKAIEGVGGTNNAFTSPDITNYYLSLPAKNIETGFWVESDRMMHLNINEEALATQKKVVIEEYKQVYLNRPYGDAFLKLLPLAFHFHPYKWPTIGRDIAHIAEAKITDVKDFFHQYYHPSNAILVIAGSITTEKVKALSNKWFGGISSKTKAVRSLPQEPRQTERRVDKIEANVPSDALYMAYHIGGWKSEDHLATNLMAQVLGKGLSSRLYRALVQEQRVFTQISARTNGGFDTGLLYISGQLAKGQSHEEAENSVKEVARQLCEGFVPEIELNKIKNQSAFSLAESRIALLERALDIALYTLKGDTTLINKELELLKEITTSDIHKSASAYLRDDNVSALYYKKKVI